MLRDLLHIERLSRSLDSTTGEWDSPFKKLWQLHLWFVQACLHNRPIF